MAKSDNTDTGQLLSPYDQRVYTIPRAEHERYKQSGWVEPAADTDEAELHKSVSNWHEQSTAESMVYSASEGWLGLPSLIEKGSHAVGHDDWAKNYADNVIMAHQQHPTAAGISQFAGNIASVTAYTAAATMAAPAVLGAAGIGAAGAAAGVGAAEAAGIAAEGLGAAEAAGAAASVGEGLSLGQKVLQAAPTYGKLGARFAAEGVGIGIVDRYDQAAIEHAASPEGQEKIVWGFAEMARDAAIGGVGGLAFVGAVKGIAALGRKLGDVSTSKLVDALLDKKSVEQVAMQGREGELRRMAKEIVPKGVERGRIHVDNIIDLAEKDMNQLKYQIEGKGNYLDNGQVQKLKTLVEEQLGGTVEGSRVLKMIEDASGETDLAATFAPGDAARVADQAAVDANRAAIKQHAADAAAWESQNAKGRAKTKAYEAHRNETSGEQARLNAEADKTHAEAMRIYESQQAKFLTPSGVRMSPTDYKLRFGKEPPPSYFEKPPVRPDSKTARIPMEEPPGQYPVPAPEAIEMRPDAHYQSLNENYFANRRTGDPDKVLNPQALQGIRKNIYDMINFKNFGRTYKGRPVDEQLRETGHIFGQQIREIFERADTSMGKQYASDWALKDEQYSAAQLLKSAIRKGSDTLSFSGLIDKIVNSAAIAGAVGATGFMGGPVAAMKAGAGYKAIQSVKPEHFYHAGRAFGGVIGQADKKLASTLVASLRNTPVVVTNYYTPARYQELASKVAVIAQDPAAATEKRHSNLIQAGVPEDIATQVVGPQLAQDMYLADQIKHVTGPADMPSMGHGDPVKLRQVMGQAETMRNPTHGIANPTQANLEVLKKFYPQTLITAQSAVYVQLRKNAKMSPKAKQWASRLLGRPINNLSSPQFSAMLQQSRAASQQAAQQAKGSPKG